MVSRPWFDAAQGSKDFSLKDVYRYTHVHVRARTNRWEMFRVDIYIVSCLAHPKRRCT